MEKPINLQTATLGGGCFWCFDAAYKLVNGITKVTQGYAGGTLANPTFQRVCTGTTGHAEVVQLTYDPLVISFEDILDVFWILHDPTTLNRQSYDVGTQYRSIILYASNEQKVTAESSKQDTAKLWDNPIVTEIKQLDHFYPAESFQNDYEINRPDYCQIIINPKLQKITRKVCKLNKIEYFNDIPSTS